MSDIHIQLQIISGRPVVHVLMRMPLGLGCLARWSKKDTSTTHAQCTRHEVTEPRPDRKHAKSPTMQAGLHHGVMFVITDYEITTRARSRSGSRVISDLRA